MDALDSKFLRTLDAIQGSYLKLDRSLQIRCERWCLKLSAEAANDTWRRNRNSHAELLLHCVRTKEFTAPFHKLPSEGPLEQLPPHVLLSLHSAKSAQWQTATRQSQPTRQVNRWNQIVTNVFIRPGGVSDEQSINRWQRRHSTCVSPDALHPEIEHVVSSRSGQTGEYAGAVRDGWASMGTAHANVGMQDEQPDGGGTRPANSSFFQQNHALPQPSANAAVPAGSATRASRGSLRVDLGDHHQPQALAQVAHHNSLQPPPAPVQPSTAPARNAFQQLSVPLQGCLDADPAGSHIQHQHVRGQSNVVASRPPLPPSAGVNRNALVGASPQQHQNGNNFTAEAPRRSTSVASSISSVSNESISHAVIDKTGRDSQYLRSPAALGSAPTHRSSGPHSGVDHVPSGSVATTAGQGAQAHATFDLSASSVLSDGNLAYHIATSPPRQGRPLLERQHQQEQAQVRAERYPQQQHQQHTNAHVPQPQHPAQSSLRSLSAGSHSSRGSSAGARSVTFNLAQPPQTQQLQHSHQQFQRQLQVPAQAAPCSKADAWQNVAIRDRTDVCGHAPALQPPPASRIGPAGLRVSVDLATPAGPRTPTAIMTDLAQQQQRLSAVEQQKLQQQQRRDAALPVPDPDLLSELEAQVAEANRRIDALQREMDFAQARSSRQHGQQQQQQPQRQNQRIIASRDGSATAGTASLRSAESEIMRLQSQLQSLSVHVAEMSQHLLASKQAAAAEISRVRRDAQKQILHAAEQHAMQVAAMKLCSGLDYFQRSGEPHAQLQQQNRTSQRQQHQQPPQTAADACARSGAETGDRAAAAAIARARAKLRRHLNHESAGRRAAAEQFRAADGSAALGPASAAQRRDATAIDGDHGGHHATQDRTSPRQHKAIHATSSTPLPASPSSSQSSPVTPLDAYELLHSPPLNDQYGSTDFSGKHTRASRTLLQYGDDADDGVDARVEKRLGSTHTDEQGAASSSRAEGAAQSSRVTSSLATDHDSSADDGVRGSKVVYTRPAAASSSSATRHAFRNAKERLHDRAYAREGTAATSLHPQQAPGADDVGFAGAGSTGSAAARVDRRASASADAQSRELPHDFGLDHGAGLAVSGNDDFPFPSILGLTLPHRPWPQWPTAIGTTNGYVSADSGAAAAARSCSSGRRAAASSSAFASTALPPAMANNLAPAHAAFATAAAQTEWSRVAAAQRRMESQARRSISASRDRLPPRPNTIKVLESSAFADVRDWEIKPHVLSLGPHDQHKHQHRHQHRHQYRSGSPYRQQRILHIPPPSFVPMMSQPGLSDVASAAAPGSNSGDQPTAGARTLRNDYPSERLRPVQPAVVRPNASPASNSSTTTAWDGQLATAELEAGAGSAASSSSSSFVPPVIADIRASVAFLPGLPPPVNSDSNIKRCADHDGRLDIGSSSVDDANPSWNVPIVPLRHMSLLLRA